MKTYHLYECEKCRKRSNIREEIELCEAKHIGLQTLEEKREYKALEEVVRHCSYMVSVECNEKTQASLDEAIEKMLKFEKDHNMIVD